MSLRERRLVALTRSADATSAGALVAFLAAHGIDAHVEGVDPLSIGLGGRVRVVIDEEDLRRARRAMEHEQGSDGEARHFETKRLDPRRRERVAAAARRARVVAVALALAFAVAALLSR